MTGLPGFAFDVGTIDTLSRSIRERSMQLNQMINVPISSEIEIQLTCADVAAFAGKLEAIASLLQTRIAIHRNRNPHVKA